MKRTLLLISVISVFAVLCNAQDDAAYMAAMKSMNGAVGAVNTDITAKDGAKAATDAKAVVAIFDTVLSYWTAKKVDDAIGFATTARDAAKAIAASTDSDAQSNSLKTLRGVCTPCHMAHRGGSFGSFTIK
jgi:hypothetical protein